MLESLKNTVIVLIAVAITAMLIDTLIRGKSENNYIKIWSHVFGWCGLLGLLNAVFCVFVGYYLIKTVPIMKWGWYSLLDKTGNILMTPVETSTKFLPDSTFNFEKMIIVGFLTLLLLALPKLAEEEEKLFRKNVTKWKSILSASAVFGFLHPLLMGVPIGAGIVLTLAGVNYALIYNCYYKKDRDLALLKATAFHTATNCWLVGLLLLAKIFS